MVVESCRKTGSSDSIVERGQKGSEGSGGICKESIFFRRGACKISKSGRSGHAAGEAEKEDDGEAQVSRGTGGGASPILRCGTKRVHPACSDHKKGRKVGTYSGPPRGLQYIRG